MTLDVTGGRATPGGLPGSAHGGGELRGLKAGREEVCRLREDFFDSALRCRGEGRIIRAVEIGLQLRRRRLLRVRVRVRVRVQGFEMIFGGGRLMSYGEKEVSG